MKKLNIGLLATVFMVGSLFFTSADAKSHNINGGTWSEGVSFGRVYSNHDNNTYKHGSSVINYQGYKFGNYHLKPGKDSIAELPSGPGADYTYYRFN